MEQAVGTKWVWDESGVFILQEPFATSFPGGIGDRCYCVMKRMVTAVSEHFHRDPIGISQGMRKLEVRLLEDDTLQGAAKGIEETLTRNRKKKYFLTYG